MARQRRRALRVTGENDPHGVRMMLVQMLEDCDAVDARHPQVGDDDVEGCVREERQGLLAAERELHLPLMPELAQESAQPVEHVDLVVDEEDALQRRPSSSLAIGRRISKVVPSPARESKASVPRA